MSAYSRVLAIERSFCFSRLAPRDKVESRVQREGESCSWSSHGPVHTNSRNKLHGPSRERGVGYQFERLIPKVLFIYTFRLGADSADLCLRWAVSAAVSARPPRHPSYTTPPSMTFPIARGILLYLIKCIIYNAPRTYRSTISTSRFNKSKIRIATNCASASLIQCNIPSDIYLFEYFITLSTRHRRGS